jgi:hypothetical protein
MALCFTDQDTAQRTTAPLGLFGNTELLTYNTQAEEALSLHASKKNQAHTCASSPVTESSICLHTTRAHKCLNDGTHVGTKYTVWGLPSMLRESAAQR